MKRWIDTFDRANGALTGSTLSGGGATWANAGDEDIWAIVSDRARAAAMTNGFSSLALVNTATDTDDVFVQINLATFTRPGNSFLSWRLFLGVDATATSGYMIRMQTNGTETELILRALTLETDVVVQANLITSGILRFQRVSNIFTLTVNGASIIAPVSDTAEPTDSSHRIVGFGESWDDDGGGGTRIVEFDDFSGGDIGAKPWPYYAQQMSA